MTQPTLFPADAPAIAVTPIVPVNYSVHREERPRLQRQCLLLIDEFRKRDLSNRDIVALGILNGTGRISEIRHAGFDVRIIERDRKSGRVVYALVSESSAQEVRST